MVTRGLGSCFCTLARTPSPTAKSVAPFVSPIRLDNRPTPVAGDTNGEMPARDLVGVAPNCVASRAAAPSLVLLFATARDKGVVLGAKDWRCGREFTDEDGNRWRLMSGSPLAQKPNQVPGWTLRTADGRQLFLTTTGALYRRGD